MGFLLFPLFLFKFAKCQEEPLIDCSSNFFRDEHSVCQLCDKYACKVVLQNKDTKYESCRGFCSSKTDPKQYVTSTSTRHPGTTEQYFSDDAFTKNTPQGDNRSLFFSPGSLPIVISVFIVVLVIGVVIMSMICYYHYQKKKKQRLPEIKLNSFIVCSSSLRTNRKNTEASAKSIANAKTPVVTVISNENDNDNETPTTSGSPDDSTKIPLMKIGGPLKPIGSTSNSLVAVRIPDNDDDSETPLPNCSDGSVFSHL